MSDTHNIVLEENTKSSQMILSQQILRTRGVSKCDW